MDYGITHNNLGHCVKKPAFRGLGKKFAEIGKIETPHTGSDV